MSFETEIYQHQEKCKWNQSLKQLPEFNTFIIYFYELFNPTAIFKTKKKKEKSGKVRIFR